MPSLRRALEWCWIAFVTCGIVWLYFWIARPAISQLLGNHRAQTAYYNRLVDGFASGHLHLAGDPAPEMAQLKNPYDPIENGPYRLHDATYYKGKYYLYFGPTPALVLFWPYHALTGDYLWHRQGVAIFGSGVFLVSVGLLFAIRRRYFPGVSLWVTGWAILGLGFANTIPIVLRRPDVWEIPITCASLFVLLALAAIWRSLHDPARRRLWLALASLSYGFAIGARPAILLGAVILLVPLVDTLRQRAGIVALLKDLAAAVIPIFLIGVALLCYNWLRFDDPLQFGQKYQLAGVDNTKVRFFSPEFFWYHARLYLWAPNLWSSYFPFVTGIEVPPPPPGQLGVESVFGIFTNLPFAWLGLFAWVRATRRPEGRWAVFAGTAALFTVVCAATVFLFGGACNRYMVDFLPPWILVCAAGLLALDQALAARSRLARRTVRVLGFGAAAVSAGFVFFSSCQHLGLLRLRDPLAYDRLARFCNAPIAAVEQWRGLRHGPLELTLRFPPFTGRRVEPILITGSPPEADYFWVEYVGPDRVRFGLEHTSYGGPISAEQVVDYSREHTVTIQFRSLYPPDAHRFWSTAEGQALERTKNQLRFFFNDREILRGEVAGYDASPQTRLIGRNPHVQAFGARFTGTLLGQRTLGGEDPARMRDPGPVAFKFWLPEETVPGRQDPLIQTGETGRADTVWIRYVDDRHIAFGFDHWSYGGPATAPIPVDRDHVQRLEIRLGSLYPPDAPLPAGDPRRRRLEVKLNGQVVLEGDYDFYPATSSQVYFGRNPAGASTAGDRLTGRISDLRRLGVER
jgi:hypothetical protein